MSNLATKKWEIRQCKQKLLIHRDLGWNCHVQVGSKRGDLDVRERTAITGGKRGHERARFALGGPCAPKFIVGWRFEVVQIRHYGGALLRLVTDGANRIK